MKNIGILDLVQFDIEGVSNQSKVFKIEGDFAYVDYFEGTMIQHRRERPVPLQNLILLSKREQPRFSRQELKNNLGESTFVDLPQNK